MTAQQRRWGTALFRASGTNSCRNGSSAAVLMAADVCNTSSGRLFLYKLERERNKGREMFTEKIAVFEC
jgi:hypothetical protein